MGNYDQAKKNLAYSLIWLEEANECAYIAGSNDFSNMLFDKTNNMLNDAIETIFTDECPSDQSGFFEFRESLKTLLN